MKDISRAFIVTDPTMVKLGYVEKVLYYLRKREQYCHAEIYSDVEPDPDVETIMRGVEAVSYTHLDVYKRQTQCGGKVLTRTRRRMLLIGKARSGIAKAEKRVLIQTAALLLRQLTAPA